MCSILGVVSKRIEANEFTALNQTMRHRGPDGMGVAQWGFGGRTLFFGHNRLSIQDLRSVAGQPMENDRFAIVFNGEIYNHLELRVELPDTRFKTHSDTETILELVSAFGVPDTIKRLNGMFAIGVFDKVKQVLWLVRDRVGIKPLYYACDGGEFAFASELKGIPASFRTETSDVGLIQAVSLGYITDRHTYYRGVQKLEPGCWLTFDGEKVEENRYWRLPDGESSHDFEEALGETQRLLQSAVKYRLLSDRKVGCFLSGGVDSSLVASLMAEAHGKAIKTFSIGFEDPAYDEGPFARQVAEHLGAEHHSFVFTSDDLVKLLDDFDTYYDEPFGDPSALPTMILSKITKDEVTVALSGDGGDELFLGYSRYFFAKTQYEKLRRIPAMLRRPMGKLLALSTFDKLEKMAYPVGNLTTENLYSVLVGAVKPWSLGQVFSPSFLEAALPAPSINLRSLLQVPDAPLNTLTDMSRIDFERYLPDDILTKVDRASMKYSLEARVPILDYRVVELAYGLKEEVKVERGPKSILKEILYRYVPRTLVDRPKRGFSVPLEAWFRRELKEALMERLEGLDERFNRKQLLKMADLHINHGRNYSYLFWNLMRIPSR